jgi:hypothetical protein
MRGIAPAAFRPSLKLWPISPEPSAEADPLRGTVGLAYATASHTSEAAAA